VRRYENPLTGQWVVAAMGMVGGTELHAIFLGTLL
jgi:hypothetical protein